MPGRGRRVWLHHGSSISHGSDAESPTTTWPALAASLGGVELVNLGFGGSALLDPFTARAMRDTPADLISVKIGINLVNTDLMRLRAFGPAVHGFLDTIREGHPTTPLLVVSPLLCPIHEDTPGPAAPDFAGLGEGRLSFRGHRATPPTAPRLTLSVIRDELARITAAGRPTTRTCTTSTAASSTARRTSPSCRCPTSSTRTPPRTAASASGSPSVAFGDGGSAGPLTPLTRRVWRARPARHAGSAGVRPPDTPGQRAWMPQEPSARRPRTRRARAPRGPRRS